MVPTNIHAHANVARASISDSLCRVGVLVDVRRVPFLGGYTAAPAHASAHLFGELGTCGVHVPVSL